MSKLSDLRHRAVKAWLFQTLPTLDRSAQGPTYREADPGVIRAAVARAQCRPSGNWFAFAASSQIATKAWGITVGEVEIVAWRGVDGALRVAPRACPHLGADLATAVVGCGTLVYPWHGLRLSDQSRGAWQPAHGPRRRCPRRRPQRGAHRRSDHPGPPPSPRLAALARLEGVCEPCDVVANRLDPWHGAWFHPYSFTRVECSVHRPRTKTFPMSSTASS